MQILKVDNTLSALDIQKKLINKGVNVNTSTIRRELKMRKYTYKKPNIAIKILTSNQMKARKLFWEKYLEEDWSKYKFTDEVVYKGGKWEAENGLLKAKNMLYLQWNLKTKLMNGVVLA